MESKLLKRNGIVFNYLLKKTFNDSCKFKSSQSILKRISNLSEFAWRNHPGFIYNFEIENFFLEIGAKIGLKDISVNDDCLNGANTKPIVFHIVSALADFGGHSRVQAQIIKRIPKKYYQVLVILNQSKEEYPEILKDIEVKDLKIISLNEHTDYIKKALILRNLAKHAKFIILNHHPNDVVPSIAFSCETNCPVIMHNHAHSWFWLGLGITDVLLSYTEYHRDHNEKRRNSLKHFLLNATQIDNVKSEISKKDKSLAKQLLGLDKSSLTLLSLGTEDKYVPNKKYNFFKLAQKILNKYQNIEIVIIGLDKGFKYIPPTLLINDRIRFCGYIKDVSIYYKACDIYIESIPQPSFGGTFYSILEGMACPLYKFGNKGIYSSENFINSEIYYKYLNHSRTLNDYLKNLDILINNNEIRNEIANGLRTWLVKKYDGNEFDKSIIELFNYSKNIIHSCNPIYIPPPRPDESDNEIAEGSKLRTMAEVFMHFKSELYFRDKFVLLLKCLLKGIHFRENLILIFKLSIQRLWRTLE